MIETIAPNLYRIPVGLPGNPLKELNSYVLTSPQRNLLIDTGFNQPECLADLRAGIQALGLDMDKTNLFLTHLHADHCGLAAEIASPTSRIYMGAVDKQRLDRSMHCGENPWDAYDERFLAEGYPPEEYEKTLTTNAARTLGSQKAFDITGLEDGQVLEVGGRRLRCIHTPGHTPGHMCLYSEGDGALFLGDHVLFDITPNITVWPDFPNPLGHYLDSLQKMRRFEAKLALPGHRQRGASLEGRIDELIEHHRQRLQQVQDIVAQNPGISAYEVASRMAWSIRAKNWADFPPGQKWFAVGEALAHLECLVHDGKLLRTAADGPAGAPRQCIHYQPYSPPDSWN